MTASHFRKRLVKRILTFAFLYACCLALITWLAWKASGMRYIRFIELEPVWHPLTILQHIMQVESSSHMFALLFVDYLNIAVYTLLFRSVILLLYDNPGRLLLLPVVMAVCDVVENFLMSLLLLEPGMTDAILLNTVVLLKLVAGGILLAVIIKGALRKRGSDKTAVEP
jgi:hypothetical protein